METAHEPAHGRARASVYSNSQMLNFARMSTDAQLRRALAGVACIAAAILMIELALDAHLLGDDGHHHFAFLADPIALFGLSASGAYVAHARRAFERSCKWGLLTTYSLAFAGVTVFRWRRWCGIRGRPQLQPREPRKDDRHLHARRAAILHRRRRHLAGDHASEEATSTSSMAPTCSAQQRAACCCSRSLNRFGAPGVVLLASLLDGVAALCFSTSKAAVRTAMLRPVGRRHPRRPAAAGSRRPSM